MAVSVLRKIRHFVWGEIPESKAERRLLLKIDWFILSYCCLMVRRVFLVQTPPASGLSILVAFD